MSIRVPTLVIDAAVSGHLEILGGASRRRRGVPLVEGVRHADACNRLLLYAIYELRRLNPRGLEDRRHDIDDVMELRTDATNIFDAGGPRDRQTLPRAAEMRGDLLGPLERRVESP